MEFLGVNYQLGLWDNETLGRIVAIDTETTYITHPSITPDLVTFQAFGGDDRVYFVDRAQIGAFFKAHENSQFVFHNAAFDIDVIIKTGQVTKQYFEQKVENYQVCDTSILYRLWKLGTDGTVPFKYNLNLLSQELLSAALDKDDAVRCNFGDYFCDGETYWDHIPDEFMDYAAKDAVATFYCYQQLANLVARTGSHSYQTHLIQLAGDIALSRISKRGIGFDVFERNKMVEQIQEMMRIQEDILASYGWARGQKGIQERYEYIVKDLLGLDLPKTVDGHISMKSEDLEPYKENHPFVKALCTFLELEHKIQYIEPLTEPRIHPRYDLIKNTGRTGASKPNIQNPPRTGGIRELFVPKKDHCFAIVDYSFIELCTLAQTTYHKYGASAMRDAINQGLDPHKYYASVMTGKPVSEINKQERQYAKACYSGNTELLTVNGWKNIKDLYNTDTLIAQYNPHNKEITFAKPLAWTKQENKQLIRFHGEGMGCEVTPDHRMLRVSRDGKINEILAQDFESNEQYSTVHGGFLHNDYFPEHTRLAVMIQADGSFQGKWVRLGFTKHRKIERCRKLLTDLKIDFKESIVSAQKVTTFRFIKPEGLLLSSDKTFLPYMFYDFSAFIDELPHWDGHSSKHGFSYCSMITDNLIVAQTILSLSGFRASLNDNSVRWTKSTSKRNRTYCRTSGVSQELLPGLHTVYCPTVSTSWVLVKTNNRIEVQGNCNFGFPGGLGVEKFVEYASTSYGVSLTIKEAERLKAIWFKAYPEMVQYMKETGSDTWTITGRKRAEASYCAAKNTPFQGLAADGAKIALWELEKAGMNAVAFIHDEIICEIPLDKSEETLENIKRIMIEAMAQVCPDVKIGVDGHITDRWRKL